jgi:hydrophobe/amphiphile efflux-3 (HAE3) family protein
MSWDGIARFPTRHPGWTVLLTLGLTLFFVSRIVDPLSGEIHLHIDPSFDAILPDGDESRDYYDRVSEEFGSDQSVILGLVMDDVFTIDNLRMVKRISERLEEAEGVDHVVSLATANGIRSIEDEIRIEPFLEELPEDAEEVARIRRDVLTNPVYAGNLVSSDGRATALVVYTDDTPEKDFTDRGLDLRMLEIAQEESGSAEVLISGTAYMRSATARAMRADLGGMLPLVIGIMGLIGMLTFRSLRGVLLPLGSIVIAVIWTLGTVAWAGVALNLVTIFLPVLLLTVGFAYAIHVVSDYYLAFRTDPETVEAAGGPAPWAHRHVALPIALTGATTLVGFLALTLSSFPAVREFGLTSALGVVATAFVSLTFAPAVLCLLSIPRRLAQPGPASSGGLFDRFVSGVGAFNLRNRRAILAAGAVIAVVSIWGVTRIEINTHLITNFDENHPVRVHFEGINHHLEGARPFSIVLETDIEGAFADPEYLRAVESLQDWLREQPEIGGTTSLADYVKLLNRAFHDDDPSELKIPDDGRLIQQLLLFGDADDLLDYADSTNRTAHIKVRSNARTTQEISALVARIESRMAELPTTIRPGITGNTVVLATSIDAVAEGQVQSLSVAVIFIYAILTLLFASFRVGFFALIPNVLPVAAFFGILGIAGVGLNATTGLIACIVLGIAVDDTIHFLTRFNADAKGKVDEKVGAISALRSVALPVTATSVALCLGFLVFTTGELRNQIEFGGLAAIVLGFAWLVDMTFTPALCSGMRVVSVFDVLTFDLGEDPQHSIPIFSGMSNFQARIAALMTDVVTFPAHTPIFRAGVAGDETYVVIEGELVASHETARGREELARAMRGDVVGEVALYHGKRTADVDAVTDVRLLRLTKTNLDRLVRRYPRIGARVLWNLSQVLAVRMAHVTERGRL